MFMEENSVNSNTEEKIKEAAARLFTRNGYASTRTRDIAKEAGINLALLNYYFRSKENLYHIIMQENFKMFFQGVLIILNDRDTDLEEKLFRISDYYITQLLEKPNLPAFVLNEIRTNPGSLLSQGGLKEGLPETIFFQQMNGYIRSHQSSVHPAQILLNMFSLIVFPFVAAPLFQFAIGSNQETFIKLMNERKKLIPLWIMQMITANQDQSSIHLK
jgi:AcrR family transcriptional regulator